MKRYKSSSNKKPQRTASMTEDLEFQKCQSPTSKACTIWINDSPLTNSASLQTLSETTNLEYLMASRLLDPRQWSASARSSSHLTLETPCCMTQLWFNLRMKTWWMSKIQLASRGKDLASKTTKSSTSTSQPNFVFKIETRSSRGKSWWCEGRTLRTFWA